MGSALLAVQSPLPVLSTIPIGGPEIEVEIREEVPITPYYPLKWTLADFYGEIGATYGMPVNNPIITQGRHRYGIDITSTSTEVFASKEGIVSKSKCLFWGYGCYIVIRHKDGMETRYAHNKENLVELGDWVETGELIAVMGETGRATGVHVHFELRER